jgi:hypothetical protein
MIEKNSIKKPSLYIAVKIEEEKNIILNNYIK